MTKPTTPKFATTEARAEAIKACKENIETLRKKASAAAAKMVKAQGDSAVADRALNDARDHLAALKRTRVSKKVVANG